MLFTNGIVNRWKKKSTREENCLSACILFKYELAWNSQHVEDFTAKANSGRASKKISPAFIKQCMGQLRRESKFSNRVRVLCSMVVLYVHVTRYKIVLCNIFSFELQNTSVMEREDTKRGYQKLLKVRKSRIQILNMTCHLSGIIKITAYSFPTNTLQSRHH